MSADLCRVCGHLAAQHEHSTRSTRCSAMQCGCLRPARTRWWHRIADWYQRPPLDLDAMDLHRRGAPS